MNFSKLKEFICSAFNHFKNRMHFIIFEEQSTTTRLFFGFVTFLFGIFFFNVSPTYWATGEYAYMMKLAPWWLWGTGFLVNGIAVMIGAYTNKYSKPQLLLEGVLGVVVWIGSAYAVVVSQNTIGAHVAAGLIAFWIYVRYPTHWEGKDR